MTPLAGKILKQLTLPQKRRGIWPDDAARALDGAQFFECTDIFNSELLDGVMDIIEAGSLTDQIAHCPAEKAWIEYKFTHVRIGYLLTEHRDPTGPTQADVLMYVSDGGIPCPLTIDLGRGAAGLGEVKIPGLPAAFSKMVLTTLHSLLFCINSPKIFARRHHPFHRGLSKRLDHAGLAFPERGWTELRLECLPPESETDPTAAPLTGSRCLHHVRSFTRVRRGKLEWVRDHWRGDPSLGIKRTRYKAVPPKDRS